MMSVRTFFLACLSAISLFLLATASANTDLFARRYDVLLVLNGALVVLLMLLVGVQLYRLLKNLRAGVFGSRLAVRRDVGGAAQPARHVPRFGRRADGRGVEALHVGTDGRLTTRPEDRRLTRRQGLRATSQ